MRRRHEVTEELAKRSGDETDGCWNWPGHVSDAGYGLSRIGSVRWRVHRYAYMLATGVDPGDWLVRHKCDNPLCFRPSHLELGTHADNSQDMVDRGRHVSPWSARTHCSAGHQYTPENTAAISGRPNARACRACGRTRAMRYLERKRLSSE